MDRFAQTPGYEWLKGRGYLWDEYTHDMTFRQSQAKTPQELAAWQNVDFLDWLNNQGAQGNMNPLAGRRGEDTFNAANDPRYSRGGWDNSASQGEGIGFGVNPDTGQPFHSADEQNQWHWANYTVDGRRKTPLPGQQATPAAPAPTAAPQAGPSPAAPPPPPYSDRPMPSMPFFPGQGPTGIMTTGSQSATTGGAPPGGPPTDSVSSLYDPLFRQQQEELARTLRGQAALDNSINSGGFNESLGRQEANLIGQQGAQKAQAIQQQQQLLMQKYGIDQQTANNMMSLQTQAGMQKYTADLGAEVQRLGITTNADLARLADSTQRYGIGINDLLQRYQAELQLKGVQYSADKGVDAAALHAAASSAAATAGAAAQKYSTDVGRQNLLSQLGERAWEAGNENNLGWGNLQAGLYNSDANRQLDWARLAQSQGLSPADIANILRGFAPTAPIPVTTGGR